MRSATAIDRFFFFNACFPVFHCSGALLGWIDVLNKWMSSLDSQTCVGMASVKENLWHFPKSKMAAGVVYCYRSPCPGVSSKAPNCFFVFLGLRIDHVGVTMKYNRVQ